MSGFDLIREADEALKEEKVMAFWKENASFLIGVAVACVIATGALSAYRTWNASVQEKQTAQILEYVDGEEFNADIAITDDLRKGVKAIPLLTAAGKLVEEGRVDDAKVLYTKAVDDKSVPALYKDLSAVLLLRLTQDTSDFERIKPIVGLPKNPWYALANMEAAMYFAGQEQHETAVSHLNAVLEVENLPPSMRTRAEALQGIYAAKESQK